MTTKLTPWYPATVKPVRVGVYAVSRDAAATSRTILYSYWNGKRFGWHSFTPARAFILRKEHTLAVARAWRGLAEPPHV